MLVFRNKIILKQKKVIRSLGVTVTYMCIVGIVDKPFISGPLNLSFFVPHIVSALIHDVGEHGVQLGNLRGFGTASPQVLELFL